MTKAFILVDDSILEEFIEALLVKIGEKDDCLDRPLEQIQVGEDEEGNPIYKIVPGDPITVTRDINLFWYTHIGEIDGIHAVIVGTTLARLIQIRNNAPPNKFLGLAYSQKDEDGNYDWSYPVDADDRTKLNVWLNGHGYPIIPSDWTKDQAVRAVYKLFKNDFEPEHYDFNDLE